MESSCFLVVILLTETTAADDFWRVRADEKVFMLYFCRNITNLAGKYCISSCILLVIVNQPPLVLKVG